MARFNIPSQPPLNIIKIDEFLGCDFTNYPTNIDPRRSPNAINMVRDVPGKVRKSMGYEKVKTFNARINGVFYLYGNDEPLIHAGTNFWYKDKTIYENINDNISKAFEIDSKLYILTGKEYLVFDGEKIQPVSDVATIPTVTIGLSPKGGDGKHYEDLNLLTPKFKELFSADGTSTTYQLSFAPLDFAPVTVKTLDENAQWVTLTEGTDYGVDYNAGYVRFVKAPVSNAPTGEDSVEITASRTVKGYTDRIVKCDVGILFGVSGLADRLFLSGNPEYPNLDWYSAQNDPTYFADLNYSQLGGENSRVMGYSIIRNHLAAHKDGEETERNIILRSGEIIDNKVSFPGAGTMQGTGCVCKNSFGYFDNEPLFLTELGIYAVTPQDITAERYTQSRSFYLDGKLLKEENLENAYACVFKDYYMLFINNKIYILDSLQATFEKNRPYASRQYAGFYRENVPARIAWVHDGYLYFGSDTGNVYRFYNDAENPLSYSDDGERIVARWETIDIDGKLFYKNKSIRYIALRLKSAVATSVIFSSYVKGIWSKIKEEVIKLRYFSWGRLNWNKFTWSNDTSPKLVTAKVRIKKVDKVRFAFVNDKLHEPFGIFDMSFEYRESGNAR